MNSAHQINEAPLWALITLAVLTWSLLALQVFIQSRSDGPR